MKRTASSSRGQASELGRGRISRVAYALVPRRRLLPQLVTAAAELLTEGVVHPVACHYVLAFCISADSTISISLEQLQLEISITGGDYADVLIDWIISVHMLPDVQEVLKDYTFPCIAHRGSVEGDSVIADWDAQGEKHVLRRQDPKSTLWAPDSLVRSLYPRNLLGAMYLQFYWLVTSAAELSRCLNCSRIIPHSPPMPESGRVRKTYRNKKFCDERCKQNYHYHNVVKPKRKARRNGEKA
jgi:hypothetical protein